MVKAALPEIPIFQDLTRDQIEELSHWLKRQEYEPGQVVFAEGTPADGLYVVARGRAAVERGTTIEMLKLPELEGPCIFGEIGLLNGEPHSAGIRALTHLTVGFLPREVFDAKLAEDNLTALRIALFLGRVLCQRLRYTTNKLLEVSELCAAQKITAEHQRRMTRTLGEACHRVLKGEGD